MQLFYNPELESGANTFTFDKEESRHIVKVLRKQNGDILFVTNGKGVLFECEITQNIETKCAVKMVKETVFAPRKSRLHIAIAPTKMNERLEWFLEKATEIGIEEITPIWCDRSERKQIKLDRLEKIVVAAMKQSGQYYMPKLNDAVSFKTVVSQEKSTLKTIGHCIEEEKRLLKSIIEPETDICVMIGPEGDFSEKEVALALSLGFVPVSLGETRLRTETAGVVAAHSVAFVNQ